MAFECTLMDDHVVAADGHTYNRADIEKWLEEHDTSPLNHEPLESKALFPNMDKRHAQSARRCVEWFNAMATAEEKAQLRPARAGLVPPDEGEQRKLAAQLHKLMEARIDDEFELKGLEQSSRQYLLSASSLDSRVYRKLKLTSAPASSEFARWRKARVEQEAASAAELEERRQRGKAARKVGAAESKAGAEGSAGA